MNQIVETYGRLIDGQIPEHPQRAADLMTAAYSLVGMQASHFPSKKRMASREFLQGYTAKLMAKLLKDPSDSAIVNIFMPSEIFHALGIPVCVPEGLSAYVVCTAAERAFIDLAEEKGASGTLCSYHKVLLGCAEAGVLKRPMMVANTTLACDANQLTFRRLADKWRVPHVVIDVPYETDEEAVDYVAAQLRGLARTAEECCGRKLDEHKLKECVARSDESMKLYRRYLSLRSGVHFPETFTPELLGAISNKLYLGTEDALTYEKLLLKDVGNAPRHTTERRIFWMHTMPNWQDDVMQIFQGNENRRAEVVGCDFACSSLIDMDPEHPYESMARRLVMDSFNGPGSRRIDRALKLARDLQADGVLIFCQWGCKQTQGIAVRAKQVFEENGLPTLILDGDGADRANGGGQQVVTRCNAFVEQLEGLAEEARKNNSDGAKNDEGGEAAPSEKEVR